MGRTKELLKACEKVVREKPFHESRGNADEAIEICESIVARVKKERLLVNYSRELDVHVNTDEAYDVC